MSYLISSVKGIHPGFILERELKKRGLSKGRFALSIQEFPQTIGAITKGKRNMHTRLALKIEKALHLEEGYFMVLQAYYEIAREKHKCNQNSPNLTLLRPVLFWDTDLKKIHWENQKKAIIKRVFERGNTLEQNEMLNFYGAHVVQEILENYYAATL